MPFLTPPPSSLPSKRRFLIASNLSPIGAADKKGWGGVGLDMACEGEDVVWLSWLHGLIPGTISFRLNGLTDRVGVVDTVLDGDGAAIVGLLSI